VDEGNHVVAPWGSVSKFGEDDYVHEALDDSFVHFLRTFPSNYPLPTMTVSAVMSIHVFRIWVLYIYLNFLIQTEK